MLIQQKKKINALNNKELVSVAPSIGATEPHHAVSDKYAFVPTLDAVNFLRDSGWIPVSASQVNARGDKKGFQKHMIRLTRPDLVVGGRRMDLVLYNSHDRGCAFRLVGGVFRFVCANGMIIGDRVAEFSHRHVGFCADAFIDSAGQVGAHVEKTAGVIDDWQTIDLTADEQGVYAMACQEVVFDGADNAPVPAHRLLRPRRWEDRNKSDLWTTMNRIQENVIKGGLVGRNKNGRRTTTRKVTSIDRDKRINQALWTLTEKMAQLKN